MPAQFIKLSLIAVPMVVGAFSLAGCSREPEIANAPEQPAPELSKAERDAEAKYSKTTRSN